MTEQTKQNETVPVGGEAMGEEDISYTDGAATGRIDHLGIVAAMCREMGLAQWFDDQDTRDWGKMIVALVCSALGAGYRGWALASHFFQGRPVAHLLSSDQVVDQLSEENLGATLDWLYQQNLSRVFTGIAHHTHRFLPLQDTYYYLTPLSLLTGEMNAQTQEYPVTVRTSAETVLDQEISRCQMLMMTTSQRAMPLLLRPVEDEHTLPAQMAAIVEQAYSSGEPDTTPVVPVVLDSSLYYQSTIQAINQTQQPWICQVPEGHHDVHALLEQEGVEWQHHHSQTLEYRSHILSRSYGDERWLVVRTDRNKQRAREELHAQIEVELTAWHKKLWHLHNQPFATSEEAQSAWLHITGEKPPWLLLSYTLDERRHHQQRGRPRRDAVPATVSLHLKPTIQIDNALIEHQAARNAIGIIATNLLDAVRLTDETLIKIYGQNGPKETKEHLFAFLKNSRFQSAPELISTPQRQMALAGILALAQLVYCQIETRLWQRQAETNQVLPGRGGILMEQPEIRNVFQMFRGLTLTDVASQVRVHRLQPVHRQVLKLLGSRYEQMYYWEDAEEQ